MEMLLCYAWLLTTTVAASKLLLIPLDHHAHVNSFSVIGEELKNRGHTVDVLVANRSEHIPKKEGLNPVVAPYTKLLDPNKFENIAFGLENTFLAYRSIFALTVTQTRDIFADRSFFQKLSSRNYDLVLMDGSDLHRGMFLIPYALGLKFVTVHLRDEAWAVRVPSLPSVEGVFPVLYMDKNSTFMDRLASLLIRFIGHNILSPPSLVSGVSDDLFNELVPDKPNIGFEKLYQEAEMFLINMNIICLESHRVSAPHYQFVQGIGAHTPKPLPADLTKFMNDSQDGAIVLTFGSGIKRIPMDLLEKLIAAFKDLKQNVIMRHVGDMPRVVPKNVLIQNWLPQNDLIAHPNTKLFITHTGNNGQLEGVFHGVPMLMMPFLGDQTYNANRAVRRGYGLKMDPKNFSVKELQDNILEIINNPFYKNNIKKCSEILRALPSPQHKAAFWIEHILAFGGAHLKPYYIDMPLWKYFMLDILGFFIICDVLLLLMLRWCCQKCRSKSRKSKTE